MNPSPSFWVVAARLPCIRIILSSTLSPGRMSGGFNGTLSRPCPSNGLDTTRLGGSAAVLDKDEERKGMENNSTVTISSYPRLKSGISFRQGVSESSWRPARKNRADKIGGEEAHDLRCLFTFVYLSIDYIFYISRTNELQRLQSHMPMP
ncbi:hypothetical protein LZ32DRAFT_235058 [Colletotrichum eremochloae]|nr:hypothetical protein LZ32DRAFT_235058 [Colletotrichum eremochloae]